MYSIDYQNHYLQHIIIHHWINKVTHQFVYLLEQCGHYHMSYKALAKCCSSLFRLELGSCLCLHKYCTKARFQCSCKLILNPYSKFSYLKKYKMLNLQDEFSHWSSNHSHQLNYNQIISQNNIFPYHKNNSRRLLYLYYLNSNSKLMTFSFLSYTILEPFNSN